MQILILAAGYNPEWIWSHYTKHTVPIAGEPLIVRTVRQLEKYNPIVITQRKEIQSLVPHWFIPSNFQSYTKTLLSTQELWDDRVIVLNGDVVFSDKALDFIVSNSTSCLDFFCAIPYDIIGFSFSREYFQTIIDACHLTKRPWMKHFRDSLQVILGEPDYTKWYKKIPYDNITTDFDDTDAYEIWLDSREWAKKDNPPKPTGNLVCGMNLEMIKDKLDGLAPWNYTINFPFDLNTYEPDNRDNELDLMLKAFDKPTYPRVMDFGASAGFYTQFFLTQKNSYVISYDNDERRLAQLHCLKYLNSYNDSRMIIPQHNINEGVHYSQHDIDLALMRDVIENLKDPQNIFNEIYHRLKPGGEFVVLTKYHIISNLMKQIGFKVEELNYPNKFLLKGTKE